ncbi:MAG: T9SS type A sorting domain-containing protein [Ignavibacteriae bacterium]|nr:T9SS type A sorting domain-containing protein [Ignavibacteriota bacterium]
MTKIKWSMLNTGNAKIIIYDISGREIQTIVNETLNPGSYEATFDGTRFASGVYFYRLTAEGYGETRKMMLIR